MKKLFWILIILLLLSACSYPWGTAKNTGDAAVAELMENIGNNAYHQGYNDGQAEKVIPCCDVCILYPTREQVMAFLAEDKTNEIPYTLDFNCADFVDVLIENAWVHGFPCWVVWIDTKEYPNQSHIIVAFEICKEGKSVLLYIEPQNDKEIKNLEVGKQPILCSGNLCEFTNVTINKIRIYK